MEASQVGCGLEGHVQVAVWSGLVVLVGAAFEGAVRVVQFDHPLR